MEDNNVEMLQGLYGSMVKKNRAVGYCRYHQAAITVKTLKCHDCLGKQCALLTRWEEHDFWRQHAQKKEWRKARKQAIANQTLYVYGG